MRKKIISEENNGFPPNPYNPHAWILGEPKIGKNTWIGAFTIIDSKHAQLTIGDGCDIACGVQIMTHSTVKRCISEGEEPLISANTIIEDYCFLGANAVILMGVEIGHHSVIGAGCVVPEGMKIPPYSLVVGVPGKIVGSSKKLLNKNE
jgi:acetyltransferase-like isoleucine patch superfamily enzyme